MVAAADPEDNFTLIRRERTTLLSKEARSLVKDHLQSGNRVPVQIAADFMARCGVQEEWARRECEAMAEYEGATAIPLEAFVQHIVVLAEMNPVAFDQLVRTREQTWLL